MQSSATKSTLEARVQRLLMDTGGAIWTTLANTVEEGLRAALDEYNTRRPLAAVGTLTAAEDGRELALSSLTGLLEVREVWFPYEATDGNVDPRLLRVPFELLDNAGSLSLLLGVAVFRSDVARVFYTKQHTLNGLDGASATTWDARDDLALTLLACGHCCLMRSVDLDETATNMAVSTPNYAALAQMFFERAENALARAVPFGAVGSPAWSGF